MTNMQKIKVENMIGRSGERVKNQFIIKEEFTFTGDDDQDKKGFIVYFQSYDSIIVKKVHAGWKCKVYLDQTYWDYSVTTRKYRNIFLGETKKETEAKIKSGEYKLTNLN